MANELTQSVTITPGTTYRLTFDASITTGVLRVYQGTQLICDTSILPQVAHDLVYVTDVPSLVRTGPVPREISVSDTITLTENLNIITTFFSIRDSISVTESITLSIV